MDLNFFYGNVSYWIIIKYQYKIYYLQKPSSFIIM